MQEKEKTQRKEKIGEIFMDIKKLEEKHGVLKLLIKGTNAAFMNSIRRTIMKDVPVLAIEKVSIYDNSSVVFDEYLAHRLGLLPIKTDLKTYKKGDSVKLMLDKEGPGTVYSRDIECTDPKIEVVAKKVPLLKLNKGQAIKLEMEAVMGTGETHVKWQPAIVSFYNVPKIENTKASDYAEAAAEICPKNVLEVKSKKVILKDPYNCILCGECRDISKDDTLKLEYDDNSFIMTIEPTGSLSAIEIFDEAVNILSEKIAGIKKAVK